MRYEVEELTTRFISNTLDAKRLQDLLNTRAAQGWKLSRAIKDERRGFLGHRREAHFLIFEREE